MTWALDVPALLAALLTAGIAAFMGHFLFMRQGLLYANTVSHTVLPGIAAAALVSSGLSPVIILLGAMSSAMLSLLFSEWIEKYTMLNTQAAMGMALTSFFALGVVMLEQLELANFHIDVEHALYGNLEGILMPSWADGELSMDDILSLPYELWMLSSVLGLLSWVLIRFRREFMVVSFDPIFARTIGLSPSFWRNILALLTACSAASCFQATGAVLTIALFAAPAATAAILGGDAMTQLRNSFFIAASAVFAGYALALYAPLLFFDRVQSFNAGGSIATAAGALLLAAAIASASAEKRSTTSIKSDSTNYLN